MDTQPITDRGRTVAACTRERIFLADALEHRPPDPELTFVLYMCANARDIARGELPGPYTDTDARHYARACLIPTELLERPTLDVHSAAPALGVPAAELQNARDELMTGATHADLDGHAADSPRMITRGHAPQALRSPENEPQAAHRAA